MVADVVGIPVGVTVNTAGAPPPSTGPPLVALSVYQAPDWRAAVHVNEGAAVALLIVTLLAEAVAPQFTSPKSSRPGDTDAVLGEPDPFIVSDVGLVPHIAPVTAIADDAITPLVEAGVKPAARAGTEASGARTTAEGDPVHVSENGAPGAVKPTVTASFPTFVTATGIGVVAAPIIDCPNAAASGVTVSVPPPP